MKVLCYIDINGEECYVNVDDISSVTVSEDGGSDIALITDIENVLRAKYEPSVVVNGEVKEL